MKNSVRIERVKNSLTQGALAEKVGVSRQTIHSTESGKYLPSAVLAMKIARALNVSVEDIFELEAKD